MAIFDIFSKRQKQLRGEISDVYSYEEMPKTLRIQIVHIWSDTLEDRDTFDPAGSFYLRTQGSIFNTYQRIVSTLCREYGVFRLPSSGNNSDIYSELVNFFLGTSEVEKVLDVIEISFQEIDTTTRRYDYIKRHDASKRADAAIEELNRRFREHGVGYQYANGQIIRIDSEFVHAEVVKPALRLLNQPHFVGAQEEFLKAHEHYRTGNDKEALNEALKSFESVMKAICEKRGWAYDKTAPAKAMIKTCIDNKLIPDFWDGHFSALRSLLESGVPTGRNKLSGHGQGAVPTEVPRHFVSYILHMTASAIVFLGEAEKACR